MNVIMLLDNDPLWRAAVGVNSLAQRLIDAAVGCRGVQRLVVSALPSWTEDRQYYRVAPFHLPSSGHGYGIPAQSQTSRCTKLCVSSDGTLH